MNLQYLAQPKVKRILLRLKWGDRFESDLLEVISDIEGAQDEFLEIVHHLETAGLLYRFKGGEGNPYLSLSDKGQVIADRLNEIEFILEGKEVETS